MVNPDLVYMKALKDINIVLLYGLEKAIKTLREWDEYPEDRREGIIRQIEGLVEKGKEMQDWLDLGGAL